jgi:selenocysteine-specific elongation factor
MHVLATAGHVDHGKSSLLRALTGQEPDRYAEEQRRGLTLDLGFVWTTWGQRTLAFVDVPGHERFVPTMLAGVGPVPAVVLVVAADGGWMPQTQEHVEALDALGVRHGLVVVTRSDLADPEPIRLLVRRRLAGTTLSGADVVAASARTGEGLDVVRAGLLDLVAALPPADLAAPVRLWVDRSFTIRGAGTVVTGTLGAGTIGVGDRLALPDGRIVTVRGLQSLDEPRPTVGAVARVAVNLRGVGREEVQRGDALTAPGAFVVTDTVDVRLQPIRREPATTALLHLGSSQVQARLRPLAGDLWRLRLDRSMPLHIGDAGLLRDPGRRAVLAGVTVLDVVPPQLRRRGAAQARAAELATATGRPDVDAEVARRGVVSRSALLAMGVPASQLAGWPAEGEWLLHPEHAQTQARRLVELVHQHDTDHPLDPGVPLEQARSALGLPHVEVVPLLVRAPLHLARGRVFGADDDSHHLPPEVAERVQLLVDELEARPEPVPSTPPERLSQLGLGRREVAAAVRAGHLVDCGSGVLVTPAALRRAVELLDGLDSPFAVAAVRDRLHSSRRVCVPLLEHLDMLGVTRRDTRDLRVLARGAPDDGRLGA